jgi:hypothetical protein
MREELGGYGTCPDCGADVDGRGRCLLERRTGSHAGQKPSPAPIETKPAPRHRGRISGRRRLYRCVWACDRAFWDDDTGEWWCDDPNHGVDP